MAKNTKCLWMSAKIFEIQCFLSKICAKLMWKCEFKKIIHERNKIKKIKRR